MGERRDKKPTFFQVCSSASKVSCSRNTPGTAFLVPFWAFIYLKRGVEETVTRTPFRQPLEKPLFKSRFRGNSGKKGSRRHKSQKRVFSRFLSRAFPLLHRRFLHAGREREREGGIKEYVGNSPSFAIDQKLFHTRCVP